MTDRLYYIGNDWLTWEDAHSLGYTKVQPDICTFYSINATSLSIIQDTSDNTYYNSTDQIWVNDITVLGLYNKVSDVTLFLGENSFVYDGYSNTITSDDPIFANTDGSIRLIEDLHDSRGYTLYKCSNFLVQNGIVISWYDSTENLYWNDSTKIWQSNAPESIGNLQDVYIAPSTGGVLALPYHIDSQVPVRQRHYDYSEQDTVLNTQHSFLIGAQYPLLSNNDYSEAYKDCLYQDIYKESVNLYVTPEEGITTPDEVHHVQGDVLVGDIQYVWVDSDEDVTFYKGPNKHIFGKTHDSFHDEYASPIYWDGSSYYTLTQLTSLGYSQNKSSYYVYTTDTEIESALGYYNITDGYFANGVWYSSLSDLETAGYHILNLNAITISNSPYYNGVNESVAYYNPIYSDLTYTNVITGDSTNKFLGSACYVEEIYGDLGCYPNNKYISAKINLGDDSYGYVKYLEMNRLFELHNTTLAPLYILYESSNVSGSRFASLIDYNTTSSSTTILSTSSIKLYKDIYFTQPLEDNLVTLNVTMASKLGNIVTSFTEMPSTTTTFAANDFIYLFLLDNTSSPITVSFSTNVNSMYIVKFLKEPSFMYDSSAHVIYAIYK